MDMRTIVSASPEHVACELADELVVLSLQTGEYYGLNPVSASVWSMLASPRTVAELRDGLLAEYAGVSPEECEQQLMELLEEMRGLKMVTVT
ncbi:MAG TPA: PqqD family protein [Gemmatimonadaceae bacterium]|nr:PqqD family protein [Gemmatimonadaceae bacterium]